MADIIRRLCVVLMICVLMEKSQACSGMITSRLLRWYGPHNSDDPSDDSIAQTAQRAEAGILNNKITFPVNQQDKSGSQNIVSHFSVGETVALSCTPDTQHGDTAADYIWKHHNKIITERNPGVSRYIVNNVGNTNFLYIHNITFYDSGSIECFKRCRNDTNFCLKKEYILRPKPRGLQDAFVEPLKNVSVSGSTKASFTCAAKLRCVPNTDPYFIWKFKGVFLSVPLAHPLYDILQQQNNGINVDFALNFSKPNEEVPYCQETVILTADWTKHNEGIVECWVRSDNLSDEWFVQKAHVQFR